MTSEPQSTPANVKPGSMFETVRQWRALKAAIKDLEAGRPKRASERLHESGAAMPFASMDAAMVEVQSLIVAGKHGAARKAVRATVEHWETVLQNLLDTGDRPLISEALKEDRSVPLHLLGSLPRHVPGKFMLNDVEVHFPDGPSAASAHDEIYKKRMYDFQCDHTPRVIDGGANIGLAALFIKSRHPAARVTCFEADSEVAVYLKKNLSAAKISDVEVIEAALWEAETMLEFSSEGSDAGRIGSSPAEAKSRQVKGVRLSPYLAERVDFLKLDIEGAELPVLRECAPQLHNVQRLFVEYHSFAGQPQGLAELMTLLEKTGFRVMVTMSDQLSPRPLLELGCNLGMDMRLNIFGIRENG